jgi:Tfp pilus assembly protein PilN
MEQLRHQQEHERQLAMVTQDKSKKRLVFIASGIGVVAIAGLVGGVVVYSNAQKHERELQAQLQDLQAKQEENNRKMSELTDKLSHATTPEERAALEQQLEDAKKKQADLADQAKSVKPSGPAHYTGPATGGAAKPNLPKCKPCAGTGDPLCPDIPGQNCSM